MKTVENFFKNNPSYVKCGTQRISERLGLSPKTIQKFRKTETYRKIKIAYLNEL